MRTLSLDFETCSEVDLRKTGVFPYARDPSTQVICMAYAFDNDPVQVWRFDQPFPVDVLDHVQNYGDVRAWNAQFEHQIWNNTLLPQLTRGPAFEMSLGQITDTMAQAAYYGLPLSLDQAATAAGTGHLKDKDGHALMMRMSRPRVKAKNGNPATWWHLEDADKLARLCAYCAQDVEVERSVANLLPALPKAEAQMWHLDQRINGRGVGLDIPLIDAMEELAAKAKDALNAKLQALTAGAVKSLNATSAMLAHLNSLGWTEDNLRKDTVEAALADANLTNVVRTILQIRADGAKTSVSKLPTMKLAAHPLDGFPCVRGMLQYYGAFRTGRWAGRLIQPQNMPRPSLKPAQIEAAIVAVKHRLDPDQIELLFGVSAMEVLSSMLRSVLVARPGKKLCVADFAQIEARVLPWLAGENKVLEVFRQGRDVYKAAAADVFGVPEDEVTSDQRQIGKVVVLALGFGGGVGAFQTMAAVYGVDLPDDRADNIKALWRTANPKIVQFWHDLEAAFRSVIRNPTSIIQVGKLRVGRFGAHVVIVLPSGRGLFYRDAEIRARADDPSRDEATYMGLNQYTRKWERLKTYGGKLAENVTQAVARDCMAHIMMQADAKGIETLLTVHDELITEAPEDRADATLGELESLMGTPPPWATDLPVGSDGWAGDRYRK